MVFAYLSFGILLTFLLHLTLRWFAHADSRHVKRVLRWVLAGLLLLLLFLLIRVGLPHIAALLSIISVLVPLLQKFHRNKGTKTDSHSTPHRPRPPMDAEEARRILGVPAHASRKDIQDAHRRMIQKNHPDTGGSEYLASQINEARDVLLDASDEQGE